MTAKADTIVDRISDLSEDELAHVVAWAMIEAGKKGRDCCLKTISLAADYDEGHAEEFYSWIDSRAQEG